MDMAPPRSGRKFFDLCMQVYSQRVLQAAFQPANAGGSIKPRVKRSGTRGLDGE